MLAVFMGANLSFRTFAMENEVSQSAPVLRNDNANFTMRLKGDVAYIKSEDPITLSLRDSDVQQVLRMFADIAGLNIVCPSPSILVSLDIL